MNIFASKIPPAVRSEMLKANLIEEARAVASDPKMNVLLDIWHDYIEPHKEKSHCVFCMNNIIGNFKSMKNDLIELENMYQKMNSL